MSLGKARAITRQEDGAETIAYLVKQEVEQYLLSALLMNPDSADALPEQFTAEALRVEDHADIFQAIASARAQAPGALRIIDIVEVLLPHLAGKGGYLRQLGEGNVSGRKEEVRAWGEAVLMLHRRRQMWELGRRLQHEALCGEASVPVASMVNDAMETVEMIASTTTAQRRGALLAAVTDEVLKRAEDAAVKGVPLGTLTGLREIDRRTNGFQASDLVVLAGRPAMGKSAAAFRWAHGVAQRGEQAVIFSGEMSREAVTTRLIAAETGISANRLKAGKLSTAEWHRANTFRSEVEQQPLTIEDGGGFTLEQIRLRCRSLSRLGKLGLVVVDHLGLMQAPEYVQRQGKTASTGYISNGLKRLAKEFRVPVLALVQLSRKVEERDDKRPVLTDLRDSGEIEQDADIVLMVYRDEYYLSQIKVQRRKDQDEGRYYEAVNFHRMELEAAHGSAEFLCRKFREGEEFTAHVAFDGERVCFHDKPEADADHDLWADTGQGYRV